MGKPQVSASQKPRLRGERWRLEWGPCPCVARAVWPSEQGLCGVSQGHEPSGNFQFVRSTWRGNKTQTEHDGLERDGVNTSTELPEKVTCGAGCGRKKEASECRAGVTRQREQQGHWPRGQSIPLTFLAPQNTDQASSTPLPLRAGVPHLIPHHPHLSCLVRRAPAPLGTVSPIVAGSPSSNESSGHPVSCDGHGTPSRHALDQRSETGCVYAQRILGLPDAAAVDQ